MADRGSRSLRKFDFWLGIPIVFILGLLKRKRRRPEYGGRMNIGVLATAAIGDTILMSAVLKDIKKAYPEAKMTLFTGPSNAAIAEMICPQDVLVKLPVSAMVKSARIIRSSGRFDLWIDFGPWPRVNSLFTYLARSRYKLGFRTPGQSRHYVYDEWILHWNRRHELENLRALVSAIGVKSASRPCIRPTWEQTEHGDTVAVHMIPGGYLSHYKEWNPTNWIKLIDGLNDHGFAVVLTGAPEDRERNQSVVSSCSRSDMVRNAAGEMPLKDLPGLLAESRLVISVNTGIMHMAAAVGCPLIALHGPTNVDRWGPVSDKAVNFAATSPSAGCLHLGFEYDMNEPDSLDTIDPDDVLAAALEILEA